MATISRYQFAFMLAWVIGFFGSIFPFVSEIWETVIVCFGTLFVLDGVRRWEKPMASAEGGRATVTQGHRCRLKNAETMKRVLPASSFLYCLWRVGHVLPEDRHACGGGRKRGGLEGAL